MKKKVFATLTIMFFSVVAMAQVKVLKPYLSTTVYDAPGMTPFVENAIAIECQSAVYKEFEPGKFKATVEITTIFTKDGNVVDFSKIALDSPVVTDTASLDGAFIDQQRFSLPNGEYQMDVTVTDLNSVRKLPTSTNTVVVSFDDGVPAVSDILLFDSYTKADQPSACTKSGLDFLPRVYPFYGVSDDKLKFYTELYNSDKLYDEGKFLVNYYIETLESSSQMKDFSFTKRMDVAQANILLNTIDINDLPSGNYYLVVEIRDRSNALVCSNSCFFQRSNPGVGYDMGDLSGVSITNTFVNNPDWTIDSLRRFISYLDPLGTETERNYAYGLVRSDDEQTMRQFLFNFWSSRAPMNPQEAFKDYLAAVKRVNMSFKTTAFPGYRSDRGYVFLKYGQPDKIVESPNEPSAYPYEIWHYYEIANQRNKRFVFMTKDRSSNDYQLIHSDVVGEVNNPRWQLEIYSRIYGQGYDQGVDQTEYEKGWGSRAGDLYNNPR